jgi:hypothetical protein
MAACKSIRQTSELEQENAKLKRLRAELSVDKLMLKDITAEMISVQFVDRTVGAATAPRSRSVLWPIFVLTFSLDPS